MREILFRAKRIDDEEWVEGYYIYHIKRTICPIGDSLKPEDEQHEYIKSLRKHKSESIVSYIYRKMKEGSNGY